MRHALLRALAALPLLAIPACFTARPAQPDDALTRGYTAEECPSCTEWNEPHSPARIHGDTYYVGTRGLGAILITSLEGHVLIDGGLPNSAPHIIENVRTLGFAIEDVRLILNSHAHYDHAGGIAALQRASGATVAATAPSAEMIELGDAVPGDPQHAVHLPFPAVAGVQRFEPGDTLRVGPIAVASHGTAGHTRGGTTWSWRSCDESGCLEVVYADSQTPISADGFRFTDSREYPGAVADFEEGHRALESLSCDILVTPHPGAVSLWERVERGPEALVDREACRRYAANARRQLERRLETERTTP